MAASKENDEKKDKANSFKYAKNHEPDEELIKYYIETILDCDGYLLDYKDCKGWHSRIHQYYVYGKMLDCEYLNDTFKECTRFLEKGDQIAKDYLVTYEKAKRDFRMTNARANDVWEYRTSPPASWFKPVETVAKEKIKADEEALLRNFENLNRNFSANDENKTGSINDAKSSDTKGNNLASDISKGGKPAVPGDSKGWCVIS